MVTRKTTGTGITAKTRLWYDTRSPGDLQLLFRHLKSISGFDFGFERLLADIEKSAQADLKKYGTADKEEPDSLAGYAARTLQILNRLKRNLAEKNALAASEEAFGLGALRQERIMKLNWDRPAMLGKKQRETLTERSAMRNRIAKQEAESRHHAWAAKAAEVKSRHPKWKRLQIAREVKRQLSETANERTIERALKKMDKLV